jgi:hypothetical protein
MSADEETIRTLLLQDMNRRIIRFCKEPHTSQEIIDNVTLARAKDPSYFETLASNSLRTLENRGMMSFTNGKWKSNEQALQVFTKYFGS